MKISEVISPTTAPQRTEPLVLSPRQQAVAVKRGHKLKLKNIIALRQAKERQSAATAVSKQDIENAFVMNAHGLLK